MTLKYPINSPQHRMLVLSLYRKILNGARMFKDKEDAVAEASEMFHNNMNETDPKRVDIYLQEAEARYEMAMHYKIWRPRQFLFPREGYETMQDVSILNPHMVPTYMASEYMKEKEEAEAFSEYRKSIGAQHIVDFDHDDEHRW